MKCRTRRRRAEVSLEQAPPTFTRRHAPAPVDSIALEQALATLSPSLRTVFLLKVVEGYSHDEIAESLGIRRGTSEVRLHRARQSLQQQLTA
jgi:RNA polymerase sigma-70 factor (ECF subfamily)